MPKRIIIPGSKESAIAVAVVIPMEISASVQARFILFLENPVESPQRVMKVNTTMG